MSNTWKNILSVVLGLLVPGVIFFFLMSYTSKTSLIDKIGPEYMVLGLIALTIIIAEGSGIYNLGEYVDCRYALLAFVPIARNLVLSNVVENTEKETLGRLKLPFILSLLAAISLAAALLTEPGKLKATLFVATAILFAIYLIIRTVYIYVIEDSISYKVIDKVLTVLIIPQVIVFARVKSTLRNLEMEEDEEDAEDE